ncbi:MAG: LacI family DNA-binding transcriptional regulator [Paludibacteraceae bacterium]|nr:LacI family DNA-binding transcriptional regulator [Paludibacteraceae bacterium]
MKTNSGRIRIKDIAEMAGVSEGSVDRILHNRGKVSAKSEAKIRAVLEKINYQPNRYASVLALHKKYTIVCFIPQTEQNEYWTIVKSGIDKAMEEYQNLNIQLQWCFFNQFDKEDYTSKAKSIDIDANDAFLIVPTFEKEASDLAQRIKNAGKQFALIDAQLEDATPLCYYGQHALQSGRMVAELLLPTLKKQGSILLVRGSNELQNLIQRREAGFLDAIRHLAPQFDIETVNQLKDLSPIAEGLQQQRYVACVVLNSRAWQIAKILHDNKIQLPIIGYDSIESNVKALQQNQIYAIIGQRPASQGFRAFKSLAEYLLFNTLPQTVNYVPIDLLLRGNIDYYSDLYFG